LSGKQFHDDGAATAKARFARCLCDVRQQQKMERGAAATCDGRWKYRCTDCGLKCSNT